MCCCGKPTINGEFGYKWQPEHAPGIHPVNPPDLSEGDELLYDEPGRCGGLDSHCYHYRVVKNSSSLELLVRHGGGDERIRISLYNQQRDILAGLDSNSRYWLLNAIRQAHYAGAKDARDTTAAQYKQAFVDGRLKKRRYPARGYIKVWIEPKIVEGLGG